MENKNSLAKCLKKGKIKGRKISVSYVSLFLVFVLIIGATASWFSVKEATTISGPSFTLTSASNLRVNEDETISNHIQLGDIYLDEVSSVDGRNIFLPTKGTFSDNTYSMVFRESNVGDRNQKYVYKDFTLKGDKAASVTYVYVRGYSVTISEPDGTLIKTYNGDTAITDTSGNGTYDTQEFQTECPVRIAFITDSQNSSVSFDPTAMISSQAQNYNAVNMTDLNGTASTQTTDFKAFSEYYFGSTPIFYLLGDTPVNATMVVWLEGSSDKAKDFAGKKIDIDVELESNWDDMEEITFIDQTIGDDYDFVKGGWSYSTDPKAGGSWVDRDPTDKIVMCVRYKDLSTGNYKTVVMNKAIRASGDTTSPDQWTAYIPKDVTTDISFLRYDATNENAIIYNAWHTNADVNNTGWLTTKASNWLKNDFSFMNSGKLQTSRVVNGVRSVTYTAKRGNGWGDVDENKDYTTERRLAPCIGFWEYSESDQTTTSTAASTSATQASTSSGGDPVVTTPVTGEIALNIPDTYGWMRTDLSGYYVMKAVFEDSSGSTFEKTMTTNSGGDRCTLNYSVNKGTKLKYFYEYNTNNKTSKPSIAIASPPTINTSWNYSYTLNSSNWQIAQ